MDQRPRPIYLFADSQLLFWANHNVPLLRSIIDAVTSKRPRAVYIGASNGDAPEFYEIFRAAMDNCGIHDHNLIRASFPPEDESFLNAADIILLAGGDVEKGWKAFKKTGMKERILEKYYQGALLIGISAGASQLGLHGLIERGDASTELIDTFKLLPFIVDSHDERREWKTLMNVIRLFDGSVKGLGIPSGAGLIYHPDESLEAIRHPVYEFAMRGTMINSSLLVPRESRMG